MNNKAKKQKKRDLLQSSVTITEWNQSIAFLSFPNAYCIPLTYSSPKTLRGNKKKTAGVAWITWMFFTWTKKTPLHAEVLKGCFSWGICRVQLGNRFNVSISLTKRWPTVRTEIRLRQQNGQWEWFFFFGWFDLYEMFDGEMSDSFMWWWYKGKHNKNWVGH